MDITGFSDIDFLVFGSCDVASADFCTGLEDQPNVCTPPAWLGADVVCVTRAELLYPLGCMNLLQNLPPGETGPTLEGSHQFQL